MRLPTRLLFCLGLVAICSGTLPRSANAQTPDTGLIGAGGDIGILFPAEAFEKTLTLDAFGEYYVTPRISIWTMLEWAKNGFENSKHDQNCQTTMTVHSIYNTLLVSH